MAKQSRVETRFRLNEARTQVQTAQRQIVGAAKRRTAEKARDRVPVRSGHLKGSIAITDEGVVATEDYANTVQRNTGFLSTAGQETVEELDDIVAQFRV